MLQHLERNVVVRLLTQGRHRKHLQYTGVQCNFDVLDYDFQYSEVLWVNELQILVLSQYGHVNKHYCITCLPFNLVRG